MKRSKMRYECSCIYVAHVLDDKHKDDAECMVRSTYRLAGPRVDRQRLTGR